MKTLRIFFIFNVTSVIHADVHRKLVTIAREIYKHSTTHNFIDRERSSEIVRTLLNIT